MGYLPPSPAEAVDFLRGAPEAVIVRETGAGEGDFINPDPERRDGSGIRERDGEEGVRAAEGYVRAGVFGTSGNTGVEAIPSQWIDVGQPGVLASLHGVQSEKGHYH
jgi:hypothetical protein